MHGKKTGGRAPGTPNKVNAQLRERIYALIDDQFDTIVEDLETLDPKERIAAFLKFLEYVLPKQREQKLDLSTLSDEQVDELLNKAINKLN